ncbi:MAG TPA: hypothetical protein P5079_05865 [Elusimicrobiota bacterium]|nr:hypothetical protein [Elusimicrobiota bacterium]
MSAWDQALWVAFILLNFLLLGTSRLSVCVRVLSAQGFLLAALPWLSSSAITGHTVVLSAASALLKGLVFPWFFMRALDAAEVRREVEPYVGFGASLFVGLAALGFCVWLARALPHPSAVSNVALPASLFALMTGLFLIVSRKKAITQALAYLVMENGATALGMALLHWEPLVVELGILLDLFAAVFVMGIAVYHINREFDHIDTDRLNYLKD